MLTTPRSRLLLAGRCLYVGTPAAPTPIASANKITNGNCEADSNWPSTGSPTTNVQSNEQAHAGTYSRKIVSLADYSSGARSNPSFQVNAGEWHRTSAWVYVSAGGPDVRLGQYNGMDGYTDFPLGAAGSWAQGVQIWRAASSSGNGSVDFYSGGIVQTYYFDDVEDVALTLSSLLSLATDPGQRNGITESHPTLTARTQCGHAMWGDNYINPTYGLFAYHDGTNANIVKLVAGTWTSLVSAAATYSAGAALAIEARGTSLILKYNGTQAGTTQTVTDAGFGTQLCGFSTYSTNTPGLLSWRRL